LPSLIDIHDAYVDREVECLSLEDLGADEVKTGITGSGIQVMDLTEVIKKKRCEFIDGDLRQQVLILMKRMTEQNLIE
jgi:hypothetical protein